jgi:glycosyltransferase involved in cell wall biosynthesis
MYIIILLILLHLYLNNKNKIEHFYDDERKVSFPFRNIYDSKNKLIDLICITAFFREDKHKEIYLKLKNKGHQFLGLTSYLEFPGKIENPYEDSYHKKNKDDYIKMCKGWCHCFKKPYDTFPKKTKLSFISESDFVNLDYLKSSKNHKKKYDFIYVCLRSQKKCIVGWQEYIHRWDFAKKAIELMVNKYKLKGLLIGRHNCPNLPEVDSPELLETTEFLKYHQFIDKIKEAKFLFECAGSTASPRVVTESMALDLPVLLYQNIVGGWKYINSKTGELFVELNDFEEKLNILLKNYDNYKPRKYIVDNYGVKNSGKKLLRFVKEVYPELNLKENKYLKVAI